MRNYLNIWMGCLPPPLSVCADAELPAVVWVHGSPHSRYLTLALSYVFCETWALKSSGGASLVVDHPSSLLCTVHQTIN